MKEKPTILIVDDDPTLARTYARMFRKQFTVITSSDVNEAVALLRGGDIDICTSDWRMPNGGGRAIIDVASVPVVLVTGSSEDLTLEDKLKVSAIVDKPCNADELMGAVFASLLLPRDVG